MKRRGRWVAVYGDWYRHPKVSGDRHPDTGKEYERLSLAARGLWVSLLSRSGDSRLDGEASLKSAQSAAPGIPDKQLRALLAELERNDLVRDARLVNYAECNITRAEDDSAKDTDAERKRLKREEEKRRTSVQRPDNVRPDTVQDNRRTAVGSSDSGLRTQDSGLTKGEISAGEVPAATADEPGVPAAQRKAPMGASAYRERRALADHARVSIEAAARAAKVRVPLECSAPDDRVWIGLAEGAMAFAEARDVDATQVLDLALAEAVLDLPRRGWRLRWLVEDFNLLVMREHIERRAKLREARAAS